MGKRNTEVMLVNEMVVAVLPNLRVSLVLTSENNNNLSHKRGSSRCDRNLNKVTAR